MKIVNDFPPNIDQIRAAFDLSGKNIVFTYGDTIYNPWGGNIDAALEAHEATHARQQEEIGGPDVWWERYLADPEFRADQEIAAYRAHLRGVKKLTKDRNVIARIIHGWGTSLAGGMYGGCVSYADALRRIKVGIL